MATNIYEIGKKLYTIGFPGAPTNQVCTEGILGGIVFFRDEGIFTGGITFGNSGGGIFDEDYNVVGIATEMLGVGIFPSPHLGVFKLVCEDKIKELKKKVPIETKKKNAMSIMQ